MLGKFWHFIWHEDSLASWLANIVLAFVLIKFLLYPFLSMVLGTSLPLVAVISESMDHDYTKKSCQASYALCGDTSSAKIRNDFDAYWDVCGSWYDERAITKSEFREFTLHNGFSKGDIILLTGKKPENIALGDIIIFTSNKPYPIIHRVVNITESNGAHIFSTKGDHNEEQIRPPYDYTLDETNVHESQIIGVARAKVPLLGWLKVGLMEVVQGSQC